MTFIDWLSGNIINNDLPKSEYLYGARHIGIIITCIVAIIVLTVIFRNRSEKTKNRLFIVFACIFLFFEIASRVVNITFLKNPTFSKIMEEILPLYFCSIAVWLLIISIFTKNKTLLTTATICGVLVTTAYLAFPAVGLNKRIVTFDAFYSIFSHSLGFVCSYLLITTKYVKFEYKHIWKTYLIVLGIITYGVISSLYLFPGNDFVFAINNPLEFDSVVPYPIIYAVFIAAFVNLFYLITFICVKIKNRIRKKKN